MQTIRMIAGSLILMLVLVACGGDEAAGNGEAASDNGGDNAQAGLSIDNLDQQVALDNTGTLAEDEPFENLVVRYPSNWHGSQDGFDITISNNQQVEANHGAILAGMQDIPEGVILIQAQSQASLQYGGVPMRNVETPDDMMRSYFMALAGQSIDPVPYEELEGLTAFRHVSVDGIEQYFPAGTVIVTVEYAEGMALYQVVFDGSIQEFEPIAREIIANATIDG